jgi:hypothetical protein
MDPTPIFVGIDVSKAHLDSAVRPGDLTSRDRNDPAGTDALVSRLKPLAPSLVVVEAAGGMELPLVAALHLAGILVAAINPRRAATTPGPSASSPGPTGSTRRSSPTSKWFQNPVRRRVRRPVSRGSAGPPGAGGRR